MSSVDFVELAKCSEEKRGVLARFLAQIQYQHIEVTDDILAAAERLLLRSAQLDSRKKPVNAIFRSIAWWLRNMASRTN